MSSAFLISFRFRRFVEKRLTRRYLKCYNIIIMRLECFDIDISCFVLYNEMKIAFYFSIYKRILL